jgi:tetratricopeptide (TPR) repeat protein
LIGDAYLFSKKPNGAKAVDYLSRSRDIDPKSASTYAHMGDAYQLVGDMGRAMSSYESAVEKDKTNLEAYMSMARIWKTSRQTDLAIEKVESAIKLNDNYAPAYKELVQLYIDKKQYDKVVAPLEKYTSLAGSDVKAKVRLVKFLCYQAKDYERAISEGEKLVISNPEEYTLHRWLAWSYGEIEKWQESYDHSAKLLAALDQDKSRQSFPTDIEYYAKAALKIKKFEEAAMLYEKLMVVDTSRSKNTDFYGVIAKAYLDNKEFGKAVEYFKKRETYSPLNGTEQANLATAYYRLKQYSEAETSFKKVVEASPTYTYGYYMIAKCKDNMELDPANKTGLAKEAFIKFVEVASTDKEKNKKNLIEAYDYLGRLAINTEPIDKVNATSYYEMILELDPNDQDAIKILEILKK